MPDFVRSQAVACDSLEVSEVVAILERLAAQLTADHESEVTGEFIQTPIPVERVYFDEPAGDEWHAFMVDGQATHLAFSREWVFRAGAV
jgi:hypothetical protein